MLFGSKTIGTKIEFESSPAGFPASLSNNIMNHWMHPLIYVDLLLTCVYTFQCMTTICSSYTKLFAVPLFKKTNQNPGRAESRKPRTGRCMD